MSSFFFGETTLDCVSNQITVWIQIEHYCQTMNEIRTKTARSPSWLVGLKKKVNNNNTFLKFKFQITLGDIPKIAAYDQNYYYCYYYYHYYYLFVSLLPCVSFQPFCLSSCFILGEIVRRTFILFFNEIVIYSTVGFYISDTKSKIYMKWQRRDFCFEGKEGYFVFSFLFFYFNYSSCIATAWSGTVKCTYTYFLRTAYCYFCIILSYLVLPFFSTTDIQGCVFPLSCGNRISFLVLFFHAIEMFSSVALMNWSKFKFTLWDVDLTCSNPTPFSSGFGWIACC